MANSYMELIYIDSDDDARKTGLTRSLDTDAATWAEFRRHEKHRVDYREASFLLDYHNRKGDLSHTIPISAKGFEAITGTPAKTDAEYRKLDETFWNEIRNAA